MIRMLKLLSSILIGILLINSCGYTQSIDTERKKIIEKTLAAIVKFDTTSLFSLVDTSFYFDIYGKEGFIYKVSYINNKLKTCQIASIMDSLITKKEVPVHSTEYILSFCRFKNNNVNPDRFDLLFDFANYEDETKILTFDIKTYKSEIIKPAAPILKPKEN
jgi:hypothetical protein